MALVKVKIHLAATGRKQLLQLPLVIINLHRQQPAWHAYYSTSGCSCKCRFVFKDTKERLFPFLVELLLSKRGPSKPVRTLSDLATDGQFFSGYSQFSGHIDEIILDFKEGTPNTHRALEDCFYRGTSWGQVWHTWDCMSALLSQGQIEVPLVLREFMIWQMLCSSVPACVCLSVCEECWKSVCRRIAGWLWSVTAGKHMIYDTPPNFAINFHNIQFCFSVSSLKRCLQYLLYFGK